jgi:acylglycerol lipase
VHLHSAAGRNRLEGRGGVGTFSSHGGRLRIRLSLLMAALIAIAGCMPTVQGSGPSIVAPALGGDQVVMADGAQLPLRRWRPDAAIEAVVVALHGFTDYSQAFAQTGEHLAEHGIALYAYDQRGFGGAPAPGRWPGSEALMADLRQVAGLVRAAHPERPLFLLGESMGAAVILAAAPGLEPEEIAGLILVAPAVWGWSVMKPALAGLLELLAHTLPAMVLPAGPLRGLASDNTAMLAALERDPRVLQSVRVDAVHGLVTLMDQALAAADKVRLPALVLYGANERLIPWRARAALFQRLPPDQRIVVYPAGHHTLLRDLEAAIVQDDVASWIRDGPA